VEAMTEVAVSDLRVLMITQKVDLNDDILGFTHTWVNKLAERVMHLHVLALSVGRHELRDNVTLYSMGKERRAGRLRRFVNFNRVVTELVLGRKIDLIFAHQCPRYAILAAPYAKSMKIPLALWYAHGGVSVELKVAHRLVDAVFTSTKEGFRIKSSKVFITGQGIDTDKFKPADRKRGDRKTVLSVGRISPIKDYETLVKAADILVSGKGQEDLEFVIVGDVGTEAQRQYSDKIRGMVTECQLERHFRFVGPVPYSEIVQYYQHCDVFVNLSHTGSLDKAILEAMACGRVPITCNEAFEELFSNYADTLMFEKGNAIDLAEKISSILEMSTDSLSTLESVLRDGVIKGHNVERLGEKLVAIFPSLLKRGHV
jgi:glycosyltransferase involved in cell wall biosynthesis